MRFLLALLMVGYYLPAFAQGYSCEVQHRVEPCTFVCSHILSEYGSTRIGTFEGVDIIGEVKKGTTLAGGIEFEVVHQLKGQSDQKLLLITTFRCYSY